MRTQAVKERPSDAPVLAAREKERAAIEARDKARAALEEIKQRQADPDPRRRPLTRDVKAATEALEEAERELEITGRDVKDAQDELRRQQTAWYKALEIQNNNARFLASVSFAIKFELPVRKNWAAADADGIKLYNPDHIHIDYFRREGNPREQNPPWLNMHLDLAQEGKIDALEALEILEYFEALARAGGFDLGTLEPRKTGWILELCRKGLERIKNSNGIF